MKAIYSSSTNTLREQSEMEAPDMEKYNNDYFLAYGHIKAYEKHTASLRTIPCDPSCRKIWTEQQVVEEGKDFIFKECDWMPETEDEYNQALYEARHELPTTTPKVLRAVPLSPPVQEDELWNEFMQKLMGDYWKEYSNIDAIDELKKLFTLTKKITP
jgi:hypothetical protein